MSKKTEALKLALEAHIHKAGMNPIMQGECFVMHPEALHKIIEVAIREALAQQPASGLNPLWVATHPDGLTTPQPAQQEPVAWRLWDKDPLGGTDHRWVYYDRFDFVDDVDPTKHFKVEPLYTSPPASKPWVGLTEEETEHYWAADFVAGAKWAEAKLREKNA